MADDRRSCRRLKAERGPEPCILRAEQPLTLLVCAHRVVSKSLNLMTGLGPEPECLKQVNVDSSLTTMGHADASLVIQGADAVTHIVETVLSQQRGEGTGQAAAGAAGAAIPGTGRAGGSGGTSSYGYYFC